MKIGMKLYDDVGDIIEHVCNVDINWCINKLCELRTESSKLPDYISHDISPTPTITDILINRVNDIITYLKHKEEK